MSAKMTQVGAAWKKTTQDGKEFLSINITNPLGPDIRLSIWGNNFKEKEGQPDFIVYKSADERPAGSRGPAKQGAFPASNFPTERNALTEHNSLPDDEIPF